MNEPDFKALADQAVGIQEMEKLAVDGETASWLLPLLYPTVGALGGGLAGYLSNPGSEDLEKRIRRAALLGGLLGAGGYAGQRYWPQISGQFAPLLARLGLRDAPVPPPPSAGPEPAVPAPAPEPIRPGPIPEGHMDQPLRQVDGEGNPGYEGQNRTLGDKAVELAMDRWNAPKTLGRGALDLVGLVGGGAMGRTIAEPPRGPQLSTAIEAARAPEGLTQKVLGPDPDTPASVRAMAGRGASATATAKGKVPKVPAGDNRSIAEVMGISDDAQRQDFNRYMAAQDKPIQRPDRGKVLGYAAGKWQDAKLKTPFLGNKPYAQWEQQLIEADQYAGREAVRRATEAAARPVTPAQRTPTTGGLVGPDNRPIHAPRPRPPAPKPPPVPSAEQQRLHLAPSQTAVPRSAAESQAAARNVVRGTKGVPKGGKVPTVLGAAGGVILSEALMGKNWNPVSNALQTVLKNAPIAATPPGV